ncbi:ankyrin repeat domain-containing protein [Candidatus Pacearchaeota archaeon]|jgi:ankyrin repeat protein|nr:ankyrin repeat domain-containing protein [Candidatus Pacearchaeota archaeon]
MNLYVAIKKNDLQNVKKYLKEENENNYNLILRYAILYGNLGIIKYLIENGANIHTSIDYPLRHAAKRGYFDVVKYLISCYSDIELKTLLFEVDNFYVKFLILEFFQKKFSKNI